MTGAVGPVPLDQPYHRASPKVAVVRFWQKYATFHGRASRSEYWWWFVIALVFQGALQAWATGTGGTSTWAGGDNGDWTYIDHQGVVVVLWSVVSFLPTVALQSRRLHDGGFTAWYVLFYLLPVLGWLTLLVMSLLPSRASGERFDVGGERQYPGPA
ncbi:DUF805 domain-containing protein [Frigoribacterium sp. Leaf186]|uniref:DUF805 domain-containing protein n=1 Tax=Frigoribacterium sp. Leaf186 TaxID=1736293 RepID=UPI0006F80623|nr:DUF805 domain-containing protein [Frigoribacterium sp. Leaf186]KQS16226.1 hypothetical protein ASG05_10545 [Frigoribacterium sp. Leaf186]